MPGTGQLTVNNPGGGAGFASVSVTGYSGSGGQFNGNFWAGGGSAPADSFFRFFCAEIGQVANSGPNPSDASILGDDELRKLFDLAYPNKAAGDHWNGAQSNFGVFAHATGAAAFQVDVWNILFDSDLSLSGALSNGSVHQASSAKNKDLDPVVYSPVFGVNDIYWGAQWLFDAVRRAGSTDSEKVIKAWEGASFNMPWGKVTMRACDHQIITPARAAVMVRENDFFPFPYTGKPVVIPEEAVTVSPADTGNPRCK